MDSISPLAKILAEANGIDWRSIKGSGEGGSVVEQDILNYLSRIMSGDEEPPATPVDEAPPGWTGEMPPMPAAVAAGGLQALSAAGVESDITEFVAQQQVGQAAPSAPTLAEAPTPVTIAPPTPEYHIAEAQPDEETEAADADMEFELDDEEGGEEGEADAAPEETPAYAAASADPQAGAAESDHAQTADVQTIYAEAGHTEQSYIEPMQAESVPAEPVHVEPVQAESEHHPETHHPETGHTESVIPEPVAAQAQPEAAHDHPAHDHPPYDVAPLDEEADFVLADPTPEPETHGQAPAEAAPVAQAAAAVGGFGLGGFLERLYGSRTEDAPTSPEPTPAPTLPEAIVSAPAFTEAAIGSAHGEHEVALAAGEATPAEPLLPESVLPEPVLPEPVLGEPLVSQAPPIPDTPVAAPLVADQWRDQEAETVSSEQPALIDHALSGEAHGAETTHEVAHEAPALPDTHEGGLGAEPEATGLDAVGLGAAGLAVAGLAAHAHHEQSHEPQASADPAPAVAHAEVAAEPEAQAEPAEAEAAPVQSSVPASNAVTLRLNVDLGVLEAARVQLSEALYREVPVTLLVARAAARSLSTLGLSNSGLSAAGGVALADHAGQPLAADLSGDFRASLSGLTEVAHGTPALLVIDASGLGLDELHRGECSLSVGRTVGENTALSLRGEVDPVRGAQFLHEVAGLLGTPIRLLF